LDKCIIQDKGQLSSVAKNVEEREKYRLYFRKYSTVESANNSLEVNGLDRCPDHVIDGFKRCVALAVVSRNIQMIGSKILNYYRSRNKLSYYFYI